LEKPDLKEKTMEANEREMQQKYIKIYQNEKDKFRQIQISLCFSTSSSSSEHIPIWF